MPDLEPDVQENLIAAAYWLWDWSLTLNTPHFIAFAGFFALGYWLRGSKMNSKPTDPVTTMTTSITSKVRDDLQSALGSLYPVTEVEQPGEPTPPADVRKFIAATRLKLDEFLDRATQVINEAKGYEANPRQLAIASTHLETAGLFLHEALRGADNEVAKAIELAAGIDRSNLRPGAEIDDLK